MEQVGPCLSLIKPLAWWGSAEQLRHAGCLCMLKHSGPVRSDARVRAEGAAE